MNIPKLTTLPNVVYNTTAMPEDAVRVYPVYDLTSKAKQVADVAAFVKDSKSEIHRLVERKVFTGKAGETHHTFNLGKKFTGGVMLVGIDANACVTAKFAALAKALCQLSGWAVNVVVDANEWVADKHGFVRFVNAMLGAYQRRTTLKTEDVKPVVTKTVYLEDRARTKKGASPLVSTAEAISYGESLMRYWADLPSNVCTPDFLAKEVEARAKGVPSLSVEVWKKKDIEKAKMGAFLAVAQGSAVEPRFIIVRYQGAEDKNEAPVALVGKGITFDSGGISLKPGANMGDMIYDMSGSAATLATVIAAAKARVKRNIIAVAACCENMPSGTATKPGDIAQSYSGKTIEILNTDAEGRLVLCDALAWVQEAKPSVIIDMATLTGACCIALGSTYTGLFTRDPQLSANLVKAGAYLHDEAWPMPIHEDYLKLMRSNVADICNLATTRDGGACSDASFLGFFVDEKVSWAHLDIASSANTGGRDHESQGRPVRLLMSYLLNLA